MMPFFDCLACRPHCKSLNFKLVLLHHLLNKVYPSLGIERVRGRVQGVEVAEFGGIESFFIGLATNATRFLAVLNNLSIYGPVRHSVAAQRRHNTRELPISVPVELHGQQILLLFH
jgi:hypothetical protein